MKPDVVRVRLETVTPLFLGGADPSACAELRPPSIKGVLRWWYRALHPKLNHFEEAEIFGGTGEGQGQASFFIVVPPGGALRVVKPLEDRSWSAEMAYLGYGLIRLPTRDERDRGVRGFLNDRPYIAPGQHFDIELRFRETDSTRKGSAKREVLNALWALVYFGGLGSRSRRGWGSLRTVQVEGTVPDDCLWALDGEDYVKCVQEILGRFKSDPPAQHTSFSRDARLFIKTVDGNWSAALAEAGRSLKEARTNHPRPSRLYGTDRELVATFLRSCEPAFSDPAQQATAQLARAPRRAVFGLPHNYFFRSRFDAHQRPEIAEFDALGPRGEQREITRRASPLLFHVAAVSRERHTILALFLPTASFLPGGAVIRGTARTKDESTEDLKVSCTAPAPPNFDAVVQFLETLKQSGWNEVKP